MQDRVVPQNEPVTSVPQAGPLGWRDRAATVVRSRLPGWIASRTASKVVAALAIAALLGFFVSNAFESGAAIVGWLVALWLAAVVVARRHVQRSMAVSALDDRRATALDGEIGGSARIANELAEAKLATQAADRRVRQILAAFPDPAAVVDPDGHIIDHNAQLIDLFPRAESGLPVNRVSRSPELIEALDGAISAGERTAVQFEERVPVRRKLLATLTPLEVGKDRPTGDVLIVFRDVSEQEKLAQMRADFITNASHELRTPLASLRGFVETLQGPARDDPVNRERFLGIMAVQANRMTRLIDDLLSLSRIEMRAHVPPSGTVDLRDVASFVVQAMEPVAAGFETKVELTGLDTRLMIRGERDEIVQVVQNLVHNAIKYGRPGGQVDVSLKREPHLGGLAPRLVLAVTDDGPGIPAEYIPRLTERFYRVSTALSRDRGGTGLGLAIVQKIVNRHRGELRIASEIGKGSTFSVVLTELVVRQAAE